MNRRQNTEQDRPFKPEAATTNDHLCNPNAYILTDRKTLAAFYNSTGGTRWTNSTNWLTDAPLDEWFGVTAADSKVTGLILTENNLRGLVPPELRSLTKLQHLDLSENELAGNLPGYLSEFLDLMYLDLTCNEFTGEVPTDLDRLPYLRH